MIVFDILNFGINFWLYVLNIEFIVTKTIVLMQLKKKKRTDQFKFLDMLLTGIHF